MSKKNKDLENEKPPIPKASDAGPEKNPDGAKTLATPAPLPKPVAPAPVTLPPAAAPRVAPAPANNQGRRKMLVRPVRLGYYGDMRRYPADSGHKKAGEPFWIWADQFSDSRKKLEKTGQYGWMEQVHSSVAPPVEVSRQDVPAPPVPEMGQGFTNAPIDAKGMPVNPILGADAPAKASPNDPPNIV